MLQGFEGGDALGALPDTQPGEPLVETLEKHTSLTNVHARDVAAPSANALHRHPLLGSVAHALGHALAGVDDVHDGRGPDLLEVLYECPGVPYEKEIVMYAYFKKLDYFS